MNTKAWWRSKTLWVNLVAGGALLVQSRFGFVISPDAQAAILTVANLILRLITKDGVGLRDTSAPGPGEFPGIDAGPDVKGS